eukprot:4087915-Pyramimonas_sp.AAC.1
MELGIVHPILRKLSFMALVGPLACFQLPSPGPKPAASQDERSSCQGSAKTKERTRAPQSSLGCPRMGAMGP